MNGFLVVDIVRTGSVEVEGWSVGFYNRAYEWPGPVLSRAGTTCSFQHIKAFPTFDASGELG